MASHEFIYPILLYVVEKDDQGNSWLAVRLQGVELRFPIPETEKVSLVRLVLRYTEGPDV